jgi:hypothetical protein
MKSATFLFGGLGDLYSTRCMKLNPILPFFKIIFSPYFVATETAVACIRTIAIEVKTHLFSRFKMNTVKSANAVHP